jgi:hypothetical protein
MRWVKGQGVSVNGNGDRKLSEKLNKFCRLLDASLKDEAKAGPDYAELADALYKVISAPELPLRFRHTATGQVYHDMILKIKRDEERHHDVIKQLKRAYCP